VVQEEEDIELWLRFEDHGIANPTLWCTNVMNLEVLIQIECVDMKQLILNPILI